MLQLRPGWRRESAKKYGLTTTPVCLIPIPWVSRSQKGKNADLLQAIDLYLVREKSNPTSHYSQTMQKWMGEQAGWVIPPYFLWGIAGLAGPCRPLRYHERLSPAGPEQDRRTFPAEQVQSEIANRARAERTGPGKIRNSTQPMSS